MSTGPITDPHELREELAAVADRARVGGYDRNRPDEPAHSIPTDDEPYSVADVLGEMMAVGYGYNSCVEVFEYTLYNRALDHGLPNVWTVHDGSGTALDALNLDNFRTASEVETHLLEGGLSDE